MLAYDFSIITIKNLPTILFLGLLSTYRLLVDVFILGYIHRGGYFIPKVWGATSVGFTRTYSGFYVVLCTGELCQWPSSWHLSCLEQENKKKNVPIYPLSKLLPLQHSLNQKQYCIVEPMWRNTWKCCKCISSRKGQCLDMLSQLQRKTMIILSYRFSTNRTMYWPSDLIKSSHIVSYSFIVSV